MSVLLRHQIFFSTAQLLTHRPFLQTRPIHHTKHNRTNAVKAESRVAALDIAIAEAKRTKRSGVTLAIAVDDDGRERSSSGSIVSPRSAPEGGRQRPRALSSPREMLDLVVAKAKVVLSSPSRAGDGVFDASMTSKHKR